MDSNKVHVQRKGVSEIVLGPQESLQIHVWLPATTADRLLAL